MLCTWGFHLKCKQVVSADGNASSANQSHPFRRLTFPWPWPCLDQFQSLILFICSSNSHSPLNPYSAEIWRQKLNTKYVPGSSFFHSGMPLFLGDVSHAGNMRKSEKCYDMPWSSPLCPNVTDNIGDEVLFLSLVWLLNAFIVSSNYRYEAKLSLRESKKVVFFQRIVE